MNYSAFYHKGVLYCIESIGNWENRKRVLISAWASDTEDWREKTERKDRLKKIILELEYRIDTIVSRYHYVKRSITERIRELEMMKFIFVCKSFHCRYKIGVPDNKTSEAKLISLKDYNPDELKCNECSSPMVAYNHEVDKLYRELEQQRNKLKELLR